MDIMGGKNQVKVTKDHQVQLMHANSESVFLSSYAQKEHFRYHWKSKSGQYHQRSSIQVQNNVKKCIYDLLCASEPLWISWEEKNQVKVTKDHQVRLMHANSECVFGPPN